MFQLTSNMPFIIVAYPVFILMILLGIKRINLKGTKEEKFIFCVDDTNYLRGISALMVLFTHLCQKLISPGLMFWYWFFGFLSVGFFMFASGYASYVQFQKKGNKIFKGYISKRLIRLYIPFLVVTSIFAICYRVSLKSYLTSLYTVQLAVSDDPTGWTPVWFIITVFVLGIFFLISFRFFKEKIALIVNLLLTVLYIIVMWKLGFGFWWYNTALAYYYGILFAKYKEKVIKFISKKFIIEAIAVCVVLLVCDIYFMSTGHYTFFPQSIAVILSLICVIYYFSKVEIKKCLLSYIGEASLELFLVQGLRGLYFNNDLVRPGIYMAVWIVLIVWIAYGVYKFDQYLLKKMKG